MAKSLIDYQKIDDLETVFAKIRSVTANEMDEIANEVFDEPQSSILIYQ